jgi:hypothetical protein
LGATTASSAALTATMRMTVLATSMRVTVIIATATARTSTVPLRDSIVVVQRCRHLWNKRLAIKADLFPNPRGHHLNCVCCCRRVWELSDAWSRTNTGSILLQVWRTNQKKKKKTEKEMGRIERHKLPYGRQQTKKNEGRNQSNEIVCF